MKKVLSVILSLVLLISAVSMLSFAVGGSLYVNGEAFNGSLGQAITAAGKDGTVKVSGTVYTEPLGKRGDVTISDITIEGENNAKILLSGSFMPQGDDNLDVLTVRGNNVTIKNLTVDARWKVDFALNTYGCTGLIIENVTVQHGIRGGVNIMTSGEVLFKNVVARNSYQAGFYFENCTDASGLKFENCSTEGNWYRTGVLVCNGYASTSNVDVSGITCKEGYFSVHDRCSGTVSGGERAVITYSAAPKAANGNAIDTSSAMYYPLEKAYQCIRFGVSKDEIKSAVCYVDTTAYGFETRVYFDDYKTAEDFLHEGEQVIETNNGSNFILVFLLRLFNSIRITF